MQDRLLAGWAMHLQACNQARCKVCKLQLTTTSSAVMVLNRARSVLDLALLVLESEELVGSTMVIRVAQSPVLWF